MKIVVCAGVSWSLRPPGSRYLLETAVHDCSCHARAIIGGQVRRAEPLLGVRRHGGM